MYILREWGPYSLWVVEQCMMLYIIICIDWFENKQPLTRCVVVFDYLFIHSLTEDNAERAIDRNHHSSLRTEVQ